MTDKLHFNSRISLKAWFIWLTAGLFYLYEFVLRASPGVIAHELMTDFGVTSTALGVLTSLYYYAYTPLQIPCGIIVDRLGPRWVVSLSALFCALGAFVFSQSQGLPLAQFGRFIIGAGSACAFISCIKLGAEWFPPSRIAMVAGLTNMMGTLGGTFSAYPFALLSNHYGWREALVICSAIGIVVMILAWIFIKDTNPNLSRDEHCQDKVGMIEALKILVKDKQVWLISLYACLAYIPISVFSELWAIPFLMKLYGISNACAAKANILLYIGVAIGSIVTAWISDRLQSRRQVMIGTSIVTIVLFLFLIFGDISLTCMYVLFFLIGLSSGAQVIGFACLNEIYPTGMAGTATGLMNSIVMVGPIFLQPFLGYILDFMWDGSSTESGLPIYSKLNYQYSISCLLICLIVGSVLIYRAKETFGAKLKSQDKAS